MDEKSAEKHFKDFYRNRVFKVIKHHGTTKTGELERAGKKLLGKKFIGVFAQDKVPTMKEGEMAIINNHVQGQPGEHWVGAVKSKGELVVFDSFGRDLKKFLPILHKQHKVLSTDRDRDQRWSNDHCGQLSLSFLMLVKKYGIEAGILI